ncbi:cupin domain-containing protein [Pedobacter fastidiosus]|uniref:Cupin domain-containing protein n=1 Tax=Pedobacter fastidiosus TaxID=2765361 RepID=A0ABR7KZH4_9SPHI|nr:cupin domain-containing protein [Pedobacter fastidiosus]MBC6113108.1 cupin domain-containing protein [Pedobacter fastidiosus]
MQESYGTLSETINGLKKDGYTLDFNINKECVICDRQNISLSPEDFEIDKVYRFEGDANPEDQSILYAISSPKFKVKGVLVNGYGISSDEKSNAVISKLRIHTASTIKNELTENIEVDIKTNEATPLRPEGDRMLDALLVEMDLNIFIEQLKNEVTWTTTNRNSITIFKSDNTTIVLIGLHKNAELKKHQAKGNIHVQLLEGEIKFTTEQQTVLLKKGKMIALKANIPHSVIAVEESFFLLTMIVIP